MDAYIAEHRGDRHAVDFSYGVTAGTTNVQKLLEGRFPVILEHVAVVEYLTRKTMANAQLRPAGCLKQALPLTIVFSLDDKRTAIWLHALTAGLKNLDASGATRKLREHYAISSSDGDKPGQRPEK